MANNSIEAQVRAEVSRILASMGLAAPASPSTDPTERPDYIAHGSEAHARLIGLEPAQDGDKELYAILEDAQGRAWRLYDKIAALRNLPGIDPDKAEVIMLRMLVGELNQGAPPVYDGAPQMFNPDAASGFTRYA